MKNQKAKIAVKDLKIRKDVKGGTSKPTSGGNKPTSGGNKPTGGGGTVPNISLGGIY
jgi:hypothetical protein